MIRKVYKELIPHVPGAVSPHGRLWGRSIKALYPDALTVFIGPCIAKKAEVREKDVAASTDFVLTFHEMRDIFEFARISPADMPEDERGPFIENGAVFTRTTGRCQRGLCRAPSTV